MSYYYSSLQKLESKTIHSSTTKAKRKNKRCLSLTLKDTKLSTKSSKKVKLTVFQCCL